MKYDKISIDLDPCNDRDMIEWYCPECDTLVADFVYQYTHCPKCGLVVLTSGEDQLVFSQGWFVDKDLLDKEVENDDD